MDLALRPRSPSELVDAAFRLLRRHYATFLTLSVVATGPQVAVQLLLVTIGAESATDGEGMGLILGLGALALVGVLAAIACYVVASGAFAALADDAVRGDRPDVGPALRMGIRRGLALLGLILVYGLATTGAFLLLIVPGVYVAVRLATVIPTLVVEGVDVGEAMRRAWARGKGRVLHSLGALLLALLIYLVPAFAVGLLQGLAAIVVDDARMGLILGQLLAGLVTALAFPIIPLVTQLLYYDLRVRAEGYDLEQMVDALGATPARGGTPGAVGA